MPGIFRLATGRLPGVRMPVIVNHDLGVRFPLGKELISRTGMSLPKSICKLNIILLVCVLILFHDRAPVFEALGIQQPTNEKTGGEAGPSVCADYINAALNHFLSNKPTSNDQAQADRPNEKKTQPSTSQNIPTAPPSQPMDVESEHGENANVAAAQERTQTFTANSGVITIDDNEQRGTGPNQTSAIPSSSKSCLIHF